MAPSCCTAKTKEELLSLPKGKPMPMLESTPWWPPAPGLRYFEVKINFEGKDYIGYLVAPPAHVGKRPMVIVIHNFQGLKFFDVHQAEYFARVGYVGLAIDMYDREKLPPEARLQPDDPEQLLPWVGSCFNQMVDVDHNFPRMHAMMQAWLDLGLNHETVDASMPPAAIGYCFGGNVVIECVRAGLNLGGIVSLHGLLQGGCDPSPMKFCNIERPTVIKGEKKEYNTNTVMMIENGIEDHLVTPETLQTFVDEFNEAGCDWQFHHHGQGAGHGFALPKSLGAPGCLHEKSDRRSTLTMLHLFQQIFPGVPQNRVNHNAAGTEIPHPPEEKGNVILQQQLEAFGTEATAHRQRIESLTLQLQQAEGKQAKPGEYEKVSPSIGQGFVAASLAALGTAVIMTKFRR